MANERRLIDATDENIKAILEKVPYYPDEIWKFTAMTKRFPAVEAVEVLHSEWEKFRHPSGTHGIRCKNCKEQNGMKKPYCPKCGAKMDGERRTEE